MFDELLYWIATSSELSVLQRWVDHEARDAKLAVALAGLQRDRGHPRRGRGEGRQ